MVTGPSGAGKTAVTDRVIEHLPTAHRLVTCTTRSIREGEVDGVDYHFVDRPNFEKRIADGAMAEWDEHYGNLYGIQKADVEQQLQAGGATVVCTDVAGAKTLKTLWPESIIIFLTAESKEVLEARIRGRGTTSEADVQGRLDRLPNELAYAKEADVVIVNPQGQLEETVGKIAQFIEKGLAQA